MRKTMMAVLALFLGFLTIALGYAPSSAQSSDPPIVGGGSMYQCSFDEGPAPPTSGSIFDSFLAQHLIQARWNVARWLAASRPAGARAIFLHQARRSPILSHR